MATEKEIEASVDVNMDAIVARKDVIADIFARAILLKDDNLTIRMRRLMSLASQMNHLVTPNSACKHKCQHCCCMAVSMNSYEARIIEEDTGIKATYEVTESLDSDAIVTEYVNKPCPFLANHGCSIYSSRPLACRLYWNISEFPYLCDMVNGRHSVPGLDMAPFHLASVFWFSDAKFADIRQFFPNVVK